LVNAAAIRTTEVTIGLKNLKEPKVTIVLLTDIHVGAVHGPKYLQKIVDRTNALNPDLVAIAGDLFDGSAQPDYRLVQPMEGLRAPAFFVTGNHEIYEGIDITAELVAKTGVTVLRNRMSEFRGLQLVGLDAPLREGRSANIFDKFSGEIDPTKPSILLYHL
jgi:predicted MPP superfamily phosphohydrolase